MKKSTLAAIVGVSLAAGFASPSLGQTPPAQEMRGFWISTVYGLDFPGGVGSAPSAQRARLVTLLDEAEAAGLNTIIFQLRGECDAYYVSNYEPWSRWLSGGNQGTAPTRPWDPFQFVIDECRRRGLEVHAWINPYRAGIDPFDDFDADHPVNDNSGIVESFDDDDGDATIDYYWLNPGDPATNTYNLLIINDILTRYDIDALHLDDYFYPYGIDEGGGAPFPDSTEFATYGGAMSLADWRRDNINSFLSTVQGTIRATPGKDHVRFGVSPSGIWRNGTNGGPSGISGLESYSYIYADSRAWLQNGWVDYLAPQLYWGRSTDGFNTTQDYDTLHDWWSNSTQNPLGRLVVPGLPAYKITDAGGLETYEAADIVSMVDYTQLSAESDGNLFFRADSLNLFEGVEDPLATQLASGPYAAPATTPPATWLDSIAPAAPDVAYSGDGASGYTVSWEPAGSEYPQWYVVYWRDSGGVWQSDIVPDWQREYTVPGSGASAPTEYAVTALDRVGNASTLTTHLFADSSPNTPVTFGTTVFIDFDGQDLDFYTTFPTNSDVTTSGDVATIAEYNNRLDPRAGSPGANSRHVPFDWDTASGGLYRLSTSGPDPFVHLTQGIGFYVKLLDGELDIALGIRETGGSGPIGGDGGISGAIELTGSQRVTASPNWQYVYFDLPNETYTGFTGDGVLDGSWGVLENLWITQVDSSAILEYDLYLDDFHQGEPHTALGEPYRVRNLASTTIYPYSVELTWNASISNDVAAYRIYRSTSPGVAATADNLVSEIVGATTYTDSGLSDGVDYYYVVTAVDYFGNESVVSTETTQTAELSVQLDGFAIE